MSSFFSELLPKLNEISNAFKKNFSDDLKAAYLSLDKFEEEFLIAKSKPPDKLQKDRNHTTTLQSINEDEDETSQSPVPSESTAENKEQRSKKRSKHEVEGMESPEVEKRQKRKASVKAQSIITKQIKAPLRMLDKDSIMLLSPDGANQNLTEKLRRENSTQKRRRRKDEDKENEPELIVQIKQEKVSIAPEPAEGASPPGEAPAPVKLEGAMPPPPLPKPRRKANRPEDVNDEETSRRRTTRTRKQTDTMPLPAAASSQLTRASSRARITSELTDDREVTRNPRGKKAPETSTAESEKDTATVVNGTASPAEKPRPKRTRKARKVSEKQEVQKEVEKEEEKPELKKEEIPLKEECIANNEIQSPVLQKIKPKITKQKVNETYTENTTEPNGLAHTDETDAKTIDNDTEKTKIISQLNCTVTISKEMDKTVVLPNGVYNHAPVTPKNVVIMNETVVLDTNREPKPKENAIMDATVIIEKVPDKAASTPADDSLMTDDSDSLEMHTPPYKQMTEPTSAVKEKVQQFEELASRVTRTKTRAMAKKEEPADNQTPPDRTKPVISTDTLTKMNSLIFNGKPPQISTSACKPRTQIPLKTAAPASASKLSSSRDTEKEDARRKKEALLDAKRELQRRKREDKMSAAAAAREAAESARRAALRAAARDRLERQALADCGRQERQRDAERRKADLARKLADTEERRRQDEAARAHRLADEQRRAETARRRQLEEAAQMKKEAAMMQKEIDRRQREFMERMKMKQRPDGERTPRRPTPMEPVYMQDGFQYLHSDEEESPERPPPVWSTSKNRRLQLSEMSRVRQQHVDKLFSVREHTPDLREIFPNIDRARLKRTSSAVWRTPPRLAPLAE